MSFISLLPAAIMLFVVGMIINEYQERRQDIKGFEKLEEIITETETIESSSDNVEKIECTKKYHQSSRNLIPVFEKTEVVLAGYVFRIWQ